MKSKENTNLESHPLGSIVMVIIGLTVTVGSFHYGFGSFEEPGAGFVPFFSGVCMASFAAIPLIISLKRGWKPLRSLWEGKKWNRMAVVTAALFLYCFSLKVLGFVLATILIMLLFSRLLRKPKWWVTILTALVTTAGFYILFQVFLESQLPRGFLGF
ncbi:MAG: tripartite tricarboxylate transporter TctB family protein [Deltaproteobacteria bacterium]|jgi:putative tricarboxylic transport membrane protein|nr:tripartite tricarboxylate transporter TctB family protein [Deltaproteobacteria bacterium]